MNPGVTQVRTRKIGVSAYLFLAALLLCGLCVSLWSSPSPQDRSEDVVANLAAGRVVIYVARDAIVVGAIEKSVEPGSHPPLVLPLSEHRMAILLGAAEWVSPSSGRPPVRLDRELPRLVGEATHRQQASQPGEASDIESVGVALLERLREVTGPIHRKMDFNADESLVELLLVNYEENYGPEVWHLKYRIAQDPLRGEYWRTRVLRPSYNQLYPPEKGQPHTLIEVRYPETPAPAVLDLLNHDDPRLARLRDADQPIARATERLARGESHKTQGKDAAAFLQAALDTVAGKEDKVILGVLYEQRGLEWVLAPPEPPAQVADEGKREPGAPTLRKKPKPQ